MSTPSTQTWISKYYSSMKEPGLPEMYHGVPENSAKKIKGRGGAR